MCTFCPFRQIKKHSINLLCVLDLQKCAFDFCVCMVSVCLCVFVFLCAQILWFLKNFEIWWLLCGIARRKINVCFQPWCNSVWSTRLKALTTVHADVRLTLLSVFLKIIKLTLVRAFVTTEGLTIRVTGIPFLVIHTSLSGWWSENVPVE